MSVVEIEDVLSSIRRLVSEDLRPTHKLVSAALQKGTSKLILTPALRIVSDLRTALPERGEAGDETPDLQAVLQDIEQDAAAEPADSLPMFGSVRLQDPLVLTVPHRADGTSVPPLGANFLTTAMSRLNGLSVTGLAPSQPVAPETIEAVVASVGAAVGPEEWEPDGGEPAPQTEAWTESVWNNEVPSDEAVGLDDAADSMLMPDSENLSDDVVETAAYDQQADTVLPPVEPPEYGQLMGQDSIVFNDAPEAKEEPLLLGAPLPPVITDGLEDADAFISEDVLREIVRDMIRDELQGTLGERITRNVRKLVRAEINRALASRDFDKVANHG